MIPSLSMCGLSKKRLHDYKKSRAANAICAMAVIRNTVPFPLAKYQSTVYSIALPNKVVNIFPCPMTFKAHPVLQLESRAVSQLHCTKKRSICQQNSDLE